MTQPANGVHVPTRGANAFSRSMPSDWHNATSDDGWRACCCAVMPPPNRTPIGAAHRTRGLAAVRELERPARRSPPPPGGSVQGMTAAQRPRRPCMAGDDRGAVSRSCGQLGLSRRWQSSRSSSPRSSAPSISSAVACCSQVMSRCATDELIEVGACDSANAPASARPQSTAGEPSVNGRE